MRSEPPYSDREFGASQSDYPKEQQMSDIVERLRKPSGIGEPMDHQAMEEAAAEIERLRAGRAAVVEECAKVLDENAQHLNKIGDPGMANHDRAMAARIRALKGGAA